MTIDEAIRARYDRFNRLWLAATGHTFEEDDNWCKKQTQKEMRAIRRKLKPLLQKHGFKNEDEYTKNLIWEEGSIMGPYCTNSIEEIDEVLRNKPKYTSLYPYEKYVINEAKKLAEWILENKSIDWWETEFVGKTFYDVDTVLRENGFKFDDGHSGNSFGMSVQFADCLLRSRDLFPYMHGALCYLVGDKGYHDDRSDLPQQEKKEA